MSAPSEQDSSIDLGSWPLLRLDQIVAANTDLLRKCLIQLTELYPHVNEDSSTTIAVSGPLDGYVQRQKSKLKEVIAERDAAERVRALLEGRPRPELPPIPPLSDVPTHAPSPKAREEYAGTKEVLDSNSGSAYVRRLPLPSELLQADTVPKRSESSSPTRTDVQRWKGNSKVNYSHHVSAPVTDAVARNWGTTFVVQSTGPRRRRSLPRKVEEDTPESRAKLLTAEREERRKGATERLLKRRRAIEAQRQRRRVKKVEDALASASTTTSTIQHVETQKSSEAGSAPSDALKLSTSAGRTAPKDTSNINALESDEESESVSGGSDGDHSDTQSTIDMDNESSQTIVHSGVELQCVESGALAIENRGMGGDGLQPEHNSSPPLDTSVCIADTDAIDRRGLHSSDGDSLHRTDVISSQSRSRLVLQSQDEIIVQKSKEHVNAIVSMENPQADSTVVCEMLELDVQVHHAGASVVAPLESAVVSDSAYHMERLVTDNAQNQLENRARDVTYHDQISDSDDNRSVDSGDSSSVEEENKHTSSVVLVQNSNSEYEHVEGSIVTQSNEHQSVALLEHTNDKVVHAEQKTHTQPSEGIGDSNSEYKHVEQTIVTQSIEVSDYHEEEIEPAQEVEVEILPGPLDVVSGTSLPVPVTPVPHSKFTGVPPLAPGTPKGRRSSTPGTSTSSAAPGGKDKLTTNRETIFSSRTKSAAVLLGRRSSSPAYNTHNFSSQTQHTQAHTRENQPLIVRSGDVFPSFASIFTLHHVRAIVGQFGQSMAMSTGRKAAAGLLPAEEERCIRHHWKLYSVYRQVIQDYATVFSCEHVNGWPEDTKNCDTRSDISDINLQSHDVNLQTYVTSSSTPSSPSAGLRATNASSLVYGGGANRAVLHFRVSSRRTEVYNIVLDVLTGQNSQWEELPVGLGLQTTWNLLWTWSKPHIDYASLLTWQKVNHYPNSRELTRKDRLKLHIQRMMAASKRHAKEFFIMPQTFVLPHEYIAFVAAFTSTAEQEASKRDLCGHSTASHVRIADPNFWIMKPVGLSRGRGIEMINDVSAVTYSERVVLQRYLSSPLLLDGYKFDLRLYVLVTSFNPLEAFIYKEGFARLSTQRYSQSTGDLRNRFVHLTNSSIQKLNEDEITKDSPLRGADNQDAGGTKAALSYLWRRLRTAGVDVNTLWSSVCTVVIKTLVACEPSVPYQPNAFELFGFDVLIDDTLKPWLIEVNASPQMDRDHALDKRVKEALIRDTVALVDPLPFDRDALTSVLSRRLSEGLAKNKNPSRTAPAPSVNAAILESDLNAILCGRRPRQYGEMPTCMGDYTRICPGTASYVRADRLKKLAFPRGGSY